MSSADEEHDHVGDAHAPEVHTDATDTTSDDSADDEYDARPPRPQQGDEAAAETTQQRPADGHIKLLRAVQAARKEGRVVPEATVDRVVEQQDFAAAIELMQGNRRLDSGSEHKLCYVIISLAQQSSDAPTVAFPKFGLEMTVSEFMLYHAYFVLKYSTEHAAMGAVASTCAMAAASNIFTHHIGPNGNVVSDIEAYQHPAIIWGEKVEIPLFPRMIIMERMMAEQHHRFIARNMNWLIEALEADAKKPEADRALNGSVEEIQQRIYSYYRCLAVSLRELEQALEHRGKTYLPGDFDLKAFQIQYGLDAAAISSAPQRFTRPTLPELAVRLAAFAVIVGVTQLIRRRASSW